MNVCLPFRKLKYKWHRMWKNRDFEEAESYFYSIFRLLFSLGLLEKRFQCEVTIIIHYRGRGSEIVVRKLRVC
jgi:hypothetical protein